MNKNNNIISLPSGELLNTNENHIYLLYTSNLIKFKEYYNGIKLYKYVFHDNLRNEIFEIIKENIKIGMPINNTHFGSGYIIGHISNNGFNVKFNNNNKFYINYKNLICNYNYTFI